MSNRSTAKRRADEHRFRDRCYAGVALRAGEKPMAYLAWDFARCECPPTHNYSGVPCISGAQAGFGRFGTLRCGRCDTTWSADLPRRADKLMPATEES